jgi:hypothetical protein
LIALIYPKDDFYAEDIAVRIGLNVENVYVVPKRVRKEEIVFKKLEKVKYAFLIVFDPWIKLDITTKKDIQFLIKNSKTKKIYAIVPENFTLDINSEKIDLKTYKVGNLDDLKEKIEEIIHSIKEKEFQENKQNSDLIVVLGLILLFILLLTSRKK